MREKPQSPNVFDVQVRATTTRCRSRALSRPPCPGLTSAHNLLDALASQFLSGPNSSDSPASVQMRKLFLSTQQARSIFKVLRACGSTAAVRYCRGGCSELQAGRRRPPSCPGWPEPGRVRGAVSPAAAQNAGLGKLWQGNGGGGGPQNPGNKKREAPAPAVRRSVQHAVIGQRLRQAQTANAGNQNKTLYETCS